MQSVFSEPRTRIQQVRREDVIAAAVTVLSRDGFSAASVDRIAQASGTTKSTVLYHFRSKEAIYDAVVTALFDAGTSYMSDRIQAETSPASRLRAYLASNLQFIADHGAHVVAVHRIQEGRGPLSYRADPFPPLVALLQDGQRAGEFTEFDPEVMAQTIRATIDSTSYIFVARAELDVDRYIGELVALFERATGAAAGSSSEWR